ncbi:MAG TPA: PAS domain-containing protein, partial [Planctomycetaceae bacterium]
MLVSLVAAAAGWALTALFVAEDSLAALIAVPLWAAAGLVGWWLATRLRDRTRQQRFAEGRLAAVADAASDAILRIDPEGLIAAWSPGAKAMYGYGSGEVVGRPLADLFAGPEAAEQAAQALEGLTGEALEQQRRDGSVFTASVTVIPSEAESGDATFIVRDVGELRRIRDEYRNAEAKYRSLTEHLPLVTYVQSLEGDRETTFV